MTIHQCRIFKDMRASLIAEIMNYHNIVPSKTRAALRRKIADKVGLFNEELKTNKMHQANVVGYQNMKAFRELTPKCEQNAKWHDYVERKEGELLNNIIPPIPDTWWVKQENVPYEKQDTIC